MCLYIQVCFYCSGHVFEIIAFQVVDQNLMVLFWFHNSISLVTGVGGVFKLNNKGLQTSPDPPYRLMMARLQLFLPLEQRPSTKTISDEASVMKVQMICHCFPF